MLDRIGDAYDEEIDVATERMTSVLEPILIVVPGRRRGLYRGVDRAPDPQAGLPRMTIPEDPRPTLVPTDLRRDPWCTRVSAPASRFSRPIAPRGGFFVMQIQSRAARAARAGFSLAELMVVIVIIGLLATLVVPNVIGTCSWPTWPRPRRTSFRSRAPARSTPSRTR
jgi:prepilin-type N-terminal cleavage/methylation domain-containing protein